MGDAVQQTAEPVADVICLVCRVQGDTDDDERQTQRRNRHVPEKFNHGVLWFLFSRAVRHVWHQRANNPRITAAQFD